MTGTSPAQISNFTLPSSSESVNGKCLLSESEDETLFWTLASKMMLLEEWRQKCNIQTRDWSSEMCFGRPKYSDGIYLLLKPEFLAIVLEETNNIHNTWNHGKPAQRPHNHTLYDIPPLHLYFM
jgi:hypothetical protein